VTPTENIIQAAIYSLTPIRLEPHISKMAGDRGSVPND